jgi:hypothetical protein
MTDKAYMTTKLYVNDMLVKESDSEAIWSMAMNKMVAEDQRDIYDPCTKPFVPKFRNPAR